MNENDAYKTSADIAYETICQNIIDGKLSPGQKLSRRDMAKLSGVSTIPVIEALHRLENEGLVESKPRWGSRVISLTDEVIQDRMILREAIECQVVRLLAKQITEEQKAQLSITAERVDTLSKSEENDELLWQEHYTFHHKMAEFTGCQSLIKALHQISLFNLLQKSEIMTHLKGEEIPDDNHLQVVQAIHSSNPLIAEEAMRTHIHRSGLFTWNDS